MNARRARGMRPSRAALVRLMWVVLAVAVSACCASCTLTRTEVPAISGPSELAIALTLQASPDVLVQDGASQSVVSVFARDASARPAAAVGLRADIAVNGVRQDFGRLSARTLTTGSDGRTAVVYTAPEAGVDVSAQTMVTLVITPSTGDARSQVPRSVDILLVPRSAP
jgi:hypothetical protein